MVVGSIGELTDVASAKRVVRGVFNERPDDELDEVRDRTRIRGSFSSPLTDCCLSELCKIGWFDMLGVNPVLRACRGLRLVSPQLSLDLAFLVPSSFRCGLDAIEMREKAAKMSREGRRRE